MSKKTPELAESKLWQDRVKAAGDDATPEDVLIKLAGDFDWRVRAAVACNEKFVKTHEAVARTLMKDENKLVKAYTAKSMGKDDKISFILSESQNFIE
jgi:hypothetical protein